MHKQKNNKGYVLITVLVLMMVLLVITYFLSDIIFSETAISRNQKAASVAFYLSEAGIQEALWQIQHDPTTQDTFLNTTNGITDIPIKELMTGGSYKVNIQNNAKASATITATGLYDIGIKQAQRIITLNVFQTGLTEAYDYDAALFVGGPDSGDIDLQNMNINGGGEPWSIYCGGNINIGGGNKTINVPQNIYANGSITVGNTTVNTGGEQQENYPSPFVMPGFDIDSDDPESYKSQAIEQNQYYTSAQFAELIKTQKVFDGIVYVYGPGGITLKNMKGANGLTINGLLISEGTINMVGSDLTVNHTTGPSGLITLSKFDVTNSDVNISGLVYVGVLSTAATNVNFTVTGAILAHAFEATNINLTLNFNKSYVNDVFEGGGNTGTPIIKFDHWEEEY